MTAAGHRASPPAPAPCRSVGWRCGRRWCWRRWPGSPTPPSGGCAGPSAWRASRPTPAPTPAPTPTPRARPGHGGLFVSEMITARGLVERNEKTRRMARFADDEPVRSIQLYGTDPATIGEAARILAGEQAADHVDLNFGCPVAKVTRKGGGAAVPVRRALFAAIVRAAVQGAGDVPVTVKMRIGVDDHLRTFLDAGRIAAGRGRRGRRPPRPHRRAALQRAGRLDRDRRPGRRRADDPGPRQRRRVGRRRRPADDRRDRVRGRRRRAGVPGPAVAVPRPGPSLRRPAHRRRPTRERPAAAGRGARGAAGARPAAGRVADRAGGGARRAQARGLVPARLPGGRRGPPAPHDGPHARAPSTRSSTGSTRPSPRRPRRWPSPGARRRAPGG